MSEFPDDVKVVADGIAADIPSTVRKGNRPFISNVIARAIMADRAALSSAAVAEREPVAWRARHSEQENWYMHPSPVGWWECQPLYLDPPPTSELEAENARLRAERYVAVAAMVRSHERSEVAEARLAEAMKALEPFAEIAGEAWADGSGWTNAACQNDRICDWFGPSAFHTARRVREGGKVDG